jgi:hypothetical protein
VPRSLEKRAIGKQSSRKCALHASIVGMEPAAEALMIFGIVIPEQRVEPSLATASIENVGRVRENAGVDGKAKTAAVRHGS